jgi:toluene monooxygenase system protein E
VAWDWGEALVALNLCIKPIFDEMLRTRLAEAASAAGDHLLAPILASLARDCEWHQMWALAACNTAVERRPEVRSVIDGWVSTWRPRAARAIEALAPLLEAKPALDGHVGVP